MPEPKIIDDAVQAAAGGGTMGAVFFFLRWTWMQVTGRADRKQMLIDAQEAKVDREWETIREELKAERQADKLRVDRIERQNQALRFAFHHVAAALIRIDPQNPAITQAEQMLATAFPVDFRLLAEQAESAISAVPIDG
ncbi:hypothetical protein [Sphingobium sp.]|uniref:hypothetical protein n=1 Tax=Sphingobium sp. TaxID=1912891 RepID=UPI003BB756E6